jgi:hypothetical protein
MSRENNHPDHVYLIKHKANMWPVKHAKLEDAKEEHRANVNKAWVNSKLQKKVLIYWFGDHLFSVASKNSLVSTDIAELKELKQNSKKNM